MCIFNALIIIVGLLWFEYSEFRSQTLVFFAFQYSSLKQISLHTYYHSGYTPYYHSGNTPFDFQPASTAYQSLSCIHCLEPLNLDTVLCLPDPIAQH